MTYPNTSRSDKLGPPSLFGGPLNGDRLVRCIYIDESGRSHEPVAIVLGIAAHGDTQLLPAERAVYAAIQEFVPANLLSKGWVYHTTDLLNNRKKYESMWPIDSRRALIHRMLAIPKALELPIFIGCAVKDRFPSDANMWGLSKDHFAHAIAFQQCIVETCKYLRNYAGEVAVVFGEDTDKVKHSIKRSINHWKLHPTLIKPEKSGDLSNSQELPNDPSLFSAREIVGQVNWTAKGDAALLWVADACAYAFRRLLCRLEYGEEMARTMLNNENNDAQLRNIVEGIDALHLSGIGGYRFFTHRPGIITYKVTSSL